MFCGGEAACEWVGDVTGAAGFCYTWMDAANCPSDSWCSWCGPGAWGSMAAPFLFCRYLPPSTGIKSLQFILFIYLFESLVVSEDVLLRACVIGTLEGKGDAFESGQCGSTKASLQHAWNWCFVKQLLMHACCFPWLLCCEFAEHAEPCQQTTTLLVACVWLCSKLHMKRRGNCWRF